MTQCDEIYNFMKKNGGITSLDAFSLLGCTRLSGQIYNLRKKGHVILSERVKVSTRHGCVNVARHYIHE